MKTFVALASALVSLAALAQNPLTACFDDTPPTPNGAPAPCADPGVCPNLVAGLGVTITDLAYVGDKDVGACDTGNFFCPSRCQDSRASCRKNAEGNERCIVNLVGRLYLPDPLPKKKNPAVVLVPGSTSCTNTPGTTQSCSTSCNGVDPGLYPPEPFCAFKTFLLQHGYVVYQAYPRGYGDTLAQSTGVYVGVRAPQEVAFGEPRCTAHPEAPIAACTVFDLEDEAVTDIADAVAALKRVPGVNPDRIAVLGHSFGGIRTVRLDENEVGIKAAVAIAPGSESWCLGNGGAENTVLQSELMADVDAAKKPLYLLQPRNDVNLNPTVELSHDLGLEREFFQAAIFPRVRDASGNPFTFGDWAHICFVTTQHDVDLWAPSVLDFIQRWGVK